MRFILLVLLLTVTSLSVTAQTCVTPESMTDQEFVNERLRSVEENVEILRSKEHKDHSLLLSVAVDVKCILEKQPVSEYVPKTFERLNEIGVSSWQGCENFKR